MVGIVNELNVREKRKSVFGGRKEEKKGKILPLQPNTTQLLLFRVIHTHHSIHLAEAMTMLSSASTKVKSNLETKQI
jgi:hypothetical protein